jgi:hypothetical protein
MSKQHLPHRDCRRLLWALALLGLVGFAQIVVVVAATNAPPADSFAEELLLRQHADGTIGAYFQWRVKARQVNGRSKYWLFRFMLMAENHHYCVSSSMYAFVNVCMCAIAMKPWNLTTNCLLGIWMPSAWTVLDHAGRTLPSRKVVGGGGSGARRWWTWHPAAHTLSLIIAMVSLDMMMEMT